MDYTDFLNLRNFFDEEATEISSSEIPSFFFEVLENTPLSEEEYADLHTFQESVGDLVFYSFLVTAVEFFFSNEYFVEGKSWNAVDFLLQNKALKLSAQDSAYLKGLRDSYMSLYEVVDIIPDEQKLVLKDLLEPASAPLQIVNQKEEIRFIEKGEFLGARCIQTPQGGELGWGLLSLSKKAIGRAKETIQLFAQIMLSEEALQAFQEETKDAALMVKKMWVKEIVEHWFLEHMPNPRKISA